MNGMNTLTSPLERKYIKDSTYAEQPQPISNNTHFEQCVDMVHNLMSNLALLDHREFVDINKLINDITTEQAQFRIRSEEEKRIEACNIKTFLSDAFDMTPKSTSK